MAVQRRVNWISQQRVDTPDMRALESAASNDFDILIKNLINGEDEGYVLRGFDLSMAGAIGGAASGLQMLVDGAAVLHNRSSQSGTVLTVPAGTPAQQLNSATNTIVDGAFAPSAINYVGLEYERFIDDTTSSQVYIWNPTTNNETTKVAPRAQILRYRVKITTSTWATNVLPLFTITTDAGNNVTLIEDRRRLLFRLGTAGRTSPNPFYIYPWTAQPEGRTEDPPSSNSNSSNPFHGGDKMLGTFKDWMDAVMSNLQEIKGTTYWYDLGSGGSIIDLKSDLGNTVLTGRGNISHNKDTAGLINWSEDIFLTVVGSRLSYKLAANPASTDVLLTDNRVAYITLVRGVDIIPNLIFTNASAIVTSVGAVSWTTPLQAGDWIKKGSDTEAGYYQIQSVDSASQVTLTETYGGSSTGAGGVKAQYAFGTYQTSAAPSGSRDIFIADREDVPGDPNVFWLYMRNDHGSSTARVYIRFLGMELEQGETEDISDTVPHELLQYIGSASESSYLPQYVQALTPGAVPEITDLLCGAASTITSNQYFLLNSAGDWRTYYVWFNKDGTGVDPAPAGRNASVEVAISTGNTAAQVAIALRNALNATFDEDFVAIQRPIPNTDTVRVTNASAGVTADAVNFNVGAPFAVSIVQQGTGIGNRSIHDGDNLTLAIKELDQALGNLAALLDEPSYDEPVDIVVSGGTPPTSIDGPVTVGSLIQLPDNTRLANLPQYYTVGKGMLEVFLNGQYLRLGVDFLEVGVSLAPSNQIQIQIQLEVGDTLEFRLSGSGGGSGGGGGGVGPQGPPGPAGPPGADAIGGPVAISTKTGNYGVALSDNVLLADATGGSILFTLPSAASAVGQVFFFKKIDSSGNAMTVQAFGAENIDGSNTQSTTTQYEAFTLVSDGSAWWIL